MKYSSLDAAIVEASKQFSNYEKEWKDWQIKSKKYFEKGRKCMEEKRF